MTAINVFPSQLIDAIDVSNATSGKDMVIQQEREAYALFNEAVSNVKIIMMFYTCVVATSFGKDSTVVMLVAIQALRELIAEGKLPADHPLVFTNIDTKVENHLVQMLSYYEQDRVAKFATEEGLNIDMRVGRPPVAKQWAGLFLSGLKIISTARVNNDCSEIMKVDNAAAIERAVAKDYGENVVTLLGSRTDESTRRAQSIKKRGHDVMTAESLIARDSEKENVFAPIVSMTDEHVWTILRCAGDEPLIKSMAGFAPIPSYAKNHRLLHIIYSDSKDGTCPTSAKRIKGDTQKAGGCGGSARTGCFLCAKSVLDKSGEAQAKQKRHEVISGNIIKVRNYIMSVAQDNRFRTFHSRAVDETTGAVALQPNVLNAETIDKIIWLLSQVTHEDRARAEAFSDLVAQGREMEDAGYRDIFEDPFMSDDDKEEFGHVYKRYAVRPLIQPMSAELALYLSLIHSRDGVRLPPYRAIHVWNATYAGERIAYPDVNPKEARIDDVPDSIMVVPSAEAAYLAPTPSEDLLDPQAADNCEWQPVPVSEGVPLKMARHYLSADEAKKYAHLKDSDKVQIGHIYADELTRKVRATPLKAERKVEVSGRAIVKRRKINGESVVTERGRTRVGSASFGLRQTQSTFERAYFSPVAIFTPTQRRHNWVMDHFESHVFGGYEVDTWQVAEWIDIDGIERALQEHDKFTSYYEEREQSIYRYGGMGPFTTMLRYGLFKMTQSSKRHASRIIRRTSYFNALGLLSLNDDELRKLALSADGKPRTELSQYRADVTCKVPMAIDGLYTMPGYRSYKAKYLLENIRAPRNARRAAAKRTQKSFFENPVKGVCEQLSQIVADWKGAYRHYAEDFITARAVSTEMRAFDGINIHRQMCLSQGFMSSLEAVFATHEGWYDILDNNAKRYFKENPVARMQVTAKAQALLSSLIAEKQAVYTTAKAHIENNTGQRTLYFWLSHQPQAVKTVALELVKKEIERTPLIEDDARQIVANAFSINDVAVEEGAMQW